MDMTYNRTALISCAFGLDLTALSLISVQHVVAQSHEACRYGFPLPWVEHYVDAAGLRVDVWFLPP